MLKVVTKTGVVAPAMQFQKLGHAVQVPSLIRHFACHVDADTPEIMLFSILHVSATAVLQQLTSALASNNGRALTWQCIHAAALSA